MDWEQNIAHLKGFFLDCQLCPRLCHVDRTRNNKGFCQLPAKIIMDCAVAHHGEEPPVSGTGGAGTIFFPSCNLGCIYCQNYQISHQACGRELEVSRLAQIMLDLQTQGCHNVEAVTPTPQTPLIMEALLDARKLGLKIPFVYNCGGYENPAIIKLLDKMVDIYLPDFKYGREEESNAFSAAANQYSRYCLESLQVMVQQVGDGLDLEDGIAQKGIIVRHLVLPGAIENSREVLRLIKNKISTTIAVSLMSQYTPIAKVRNHQQLGRRITAGEYNRVVDCALDLGFENLFIQEVNDFSLTPDFAKDNPFAD